MEPERGDLAAAFGSEAYRRERTDFWPRQWLVVGREDELPEPAHYFTWERTGVPLLILRSSDGEVRSFYNSCRHRGAPVVREARGRNRALRCQYHSWTYDTQGRLVSVPDERDFVDLRLEERSLVPIRVRVADGWIFAVEPGNELAPLIRESAAGPVLRTLKSLSVSAGCDWKVAAARLGDIAAEWIGGDGEVLPPNGWVSVRADAGLGLFAWPVGPGNCEVQASVSAPDWDEEDNPVDSPAWQTKLAALNAAMQRVAGEAAAEQDRIDRTGEATAATRAICADVARVLGGS